MTLQGRIDANLEARLTLQTGTDGHQEDVEFLIDTGFNGFVAIPMSLVNRLNLSLGAVQSGVTADGRSGYFDTVSVTLLWHDRLISIHAQVLEEPLLGTRLLQGNELSANWIAGGTFQLSKL